MCFQLTLDVNMSQNVLFQSKKLLVGVYGCLNSSQESNCSLTLKMYYMVNTFPVKLAVWGLFLKKQKKKLL